MRHSIHRDAVDCRMKCHRFKVIDEQELVAFLPCGLPTSTFKETRHLEPRCASARCELPSHADLIGVAVKRFCEADSCGASTRCKGQFGGMP
jgi:hypothetical protein